MKSVVRIPLLADPGQLQRLLALQREFAHACNAVAPLVQQTRTWNRVTLHHLAYRMLRDSFPGIGSQMACNAIYSVSRTARLVFQTPGSPFHHTRLVGQPLPRLQFLETTPVYFDRHTLSLKHGQASMYTLDGRMKFQLALQPEQEAAFHECKLLEAALLRVGNSFELQFTFGPVATAPAGLLANDASAAAASIDAGDPSWDASSTLSAPPPSSTPSGGTKAAMPPPIGLPAYLSIEASA